MISLAFWLVLAVLLGYFFYEYHWRHRIFPNTRSQIEAATEDDPDERERRLAAMSFPLPSFVKPGLIALTAVLFSFFIFDKVFFYAEPGYIYHVRLITGQERTVDGVGYSMHLFGRINAWKKAMTVQAVGGDSNRKSNYLSTGNEVVAESESNQASANLTPQNIMFLDQVDADAMATVRYRIPTDAETFLKMAHEYRTPANLLRVALIPAFQETLQATASLMSAEDYYSGGRTEFINEFENQMQNGIYLVKRRELRRQINKPQTAQADASNPQQADEFGDQFQTIFVVEKQLDDSGLPRRKEQKFTLYGITVHEARVTDMRPNQKFVLRMEQKQEASAKRAIQREQRIQEEEQRLLAITRGDREVAERQAQMKVEQIQVTTAAETKKKQALIEAERQRQQAKIQEETARILLEKAKVDAEAVRVTAEAEAYRKQKILEADNALAQKLEAEIEIQKIWAQAFAQRAVPQYVFGSGAGEGAAPSGSDQEVKQFMQILTLDAAQRLNYTRDLTRESQGEVTAQVAPGAQ